MRKKYTTRPAKSCNDFEDYWYVDGTESLARTVYEPENEPYNTGLLNASGDPIYASVQMDQIGFIRKDE